MADDARETPLRIAVSDSRLLWERGVVLPPFDASQTWAVDLAVDLAHGRVQRMPPVSVSNGRAVQLYQLLCDVKTRPASCRGLAFGHASWGAVCLALRHLGYWGGENQKLLSRRPVHRTIR